MTVPITLIGNEGPGVNDFLDTTGDGFVDGTAHWVKDLKVYHYDLETGKWTVLPDSTVDTTTRLATSDGDFW